MNKPSRPRLTDQEIIARCREIAGVYEKVESMLAADGFGTFGHQITGAVRLLRSDPQRLREEQARARFILIDEFQDANLAQIELVRLLAGEGANVFAVGDPDQAIYRFRGATAGAFHDSKPTAVAAGFSCSFVKLRSRFTCLASDHHLAS